MANTNCSICNAINSNNTATDNSGSPVTFTATCNIGDTSQTTAGDETMDDENSNFITNNLVSIITGVSALVLIIIIVVVIILIS